MIAKTIKNIINEDCDINEFIVVALFMHANAILGNMKIIRIIIILCIVLLLN